MTWIRELQLCNETSVVFFVVEVWVVKSIVVIVYSRLCEIGDKLSRRRGLGNYINEMMLKRMLGWLRR